MKYFKALVFILIPLLVFSQDFGKQWTGHYSYFRIKDLHATDNKIYAASENAVFIYDIATSNSQSYSTIDGLSGEEVTAIYHSSTFDITAIGYKNGLIELLVDDTTRTFIDIVDKPTIPPTQKNINGFYENGSILYISTGFGIVEFNLERIEFGDTFFIGAGGSQINITSTVIQDNTLYASSTTNGVLSASVSNPNLVDFRQWTNDVAGNFDGITVINNTVIVWNNSTVSSLSNGSLSPLITTPSAIIDLKVNSESIVISLQDQALIYDQSFQQINDLPSTTGDSFLLNSAIKVGESLYLGTDARGVLEVAINNPSSKNDISPEGPLHNDPFSVEVSNNNLWVVFGAYSGSFNPFPLKQRGISRLNNDTWQNIPKDQVLGATSLCDIAINPDNEEQVFISSYQNGLLEINDNTVTKLYDVKNSDFGSLVQGDNVVRLNALAFDENSDLWIACNRTDTILRKFNPQTEELIGASASSNVVPSDNLGFSETTIDESGNLYVGSGQGGIIAFNPNSGLFVNVSGESANLPSNIIRSLQIDRNNQLWIGTQFGLRVLFNPAEVFQGGNRRSEQIIILDDERVPQELLFGQTITDIAVDGSNNKWIGTSASGVFYLSSDGQETLAQFSTQNSPLPSDNILDIAIDDSTGAVYFATENGLLEFKGTATGPEETLSKVVAFPNPVRPKFSGNVTIKGLTSKANVKITDIEGNLVYEETTEGGSIQWDTTAFGRHKVASGVYLILVTGEDQLETTVSKLLIVR